MLTGQFWKTSHPVRPEAEQKILDCIHELETERKGLFLTLIKLNARLREKYNRTFGPSSS
jgi:hypothetical protein